MAVDSYEAVTDTAGRVEIVNARSVSGKRVGALRAATEKNCVTLFAQQFTGISTSGDTGDITVSQYAELQVLCNLTALTGTSVQFKAQVKDAFGQYYTVWSGTTLNATGTSNQSIGAGLQTNVSLGDIVKITWSLTAVTTCNFSVTVKAK